MKPVSFYIPCFNAAKTIRLCLDAILKQTYPLEEVLVIDDGSTDETVKLATQYPVRLISHNENRGLAAARNTAIRNINTEFIASIDADCVPEPDWLSWIMERFDSPKTAGAGGKLLEMDSSSVFDFWRSVHMKQYWKDSQVFPPFLFGSNTVFRRKALINIGLYNENYKSNYEDVDICNRFREAGYVLIYEPKAAARHLRRDDIYSVLNNYWKWNLAYYQKEKHYSPPKNLAFKIKDNLGLANRYLEEDIASRRYQLLYLDFLLSLHHSLRDFEYFISQNNQENGASPLSSWLSLLDLTFFYHFNSGKRNLSTLMPEESAFLQNFFALNLVLGRFIQERFKNEKFKKILYKHLFLSVYKINDSYLLDKLLNLVEFHQDWGGLFKKEHPYLNISFLENLSINFQEWLKDLTSRYPELVQMIKVSAEKTVTSPAFGKEAIAQ